MKYLIRLNLLFLFVLGTSFAMAQSGFEGVITYNTTNPSISEKATVKWFHKDGQNHMEFDSKAGDAQLQYSMQMDSESESVYLTTAKGSQEVSGITGEKVFTTAKYVRKVKTTENGYECEMLMFKTEDGSDLVYWVTTEAGPTYDQLPRLMKNNMPSFSGITNGFPIKMELRDASGELLRSQDVASIEAKSVDGSKFKR